MQFKDFSMVVFWTKTRSPRWKLKSRIVVAWSLSKRRAASSQANMTQARRLAKWDRRFCRAIAQVVIRLVVDMTAVGSGSRYVASAMLRGRIRWVPVAVK